MNRKMNNLTPDDFSVGICMTVLHNRKYQAFFDTDCETNYLKGTVLQISAINLPYLVVKAFDPQRGRAHITIDVRNHQFAHVNDDYVKAVQQACCDVPDDAATTPPQ